MNRIGITIILLLLLGLIGFASIVRVTGPGWSGASGPPLVPQPAAAAASGATPAGAAAPTRIASPVAVATPRPAPAGPLTIPVQGVAPAALVDTWADPRGDGTRVHHAIDIPAALGTPVLAAAGGRIEKMFESRLGGHTLYERSADGGTVYYYAHLDRYAPTLVEGQAVTAGQQIATVGATGDADPGAPHLHFEIHSMAPGERWWQGAEINPYPLLRAGH